MNEEAKDILLTAISLWTTLTTRQKPELYKPAQCLGTIKIELKISSALV